jgi:hypothetical protein
MTITYKFVDLGAGKAGMWIVAGLGFAAVAFSRHRIPDGQLRGREERHEEPILSMAVRKATRHGLLQRTKSQRQRPLVAARLSLGQAGASA